MTGVRPVGVLNRGAWTAEEDLLLKRYIEANGVGRWITLPHKAGLMRCGKSCRLRWMNHLRPNVKRGHISPDEEDLIIRLHNLVGNRWSLIAGRVPGRTDNEVKNYWNTHLSKKLAGKSFARCKTVTQIVQGQPLSCVDHQKTKAKAAINSFDDHTRKWRSKNETSEKTVFPDNFRFVSTLVSPKDSKQGYSGALPGFQLADVTVNCSADRDKTDPAILEDDYNHICGANDEFHGSTGNMDKDMADLLPMFATDFFSDLCWSWNDNLFWENEFA